MVLQNFHCIYARKLHTLSTDAHTHRPKHRRTVYNSYVERSSVDDSSHVAEAAATGDPFIVQPLSAVQLDKHKHTHHTSINITLAMTTMMMTIIMHRF